MGNQVGCWKCGKTVIDTDAICRHCGVEKPGQRPELQIPSILMTTTPHVDGRPAESYLGLVTGETLVPTNLLGNLLGSLPAAERSVREAQRAALVKMASQAQSLGANAVLGVRADCQLLSAQNGVWLATATGTAVVITEAKRRRR